MNRRTIKALARRDLTMVLRSKGVMLPLIIVPALFMVIIPAAMGALAPLIEDIPGNTPSEITAYLEQMPPDLRARLAGYDETQTMIVLTLVYFFAPMYLILPLMVSSVIAADSFAGEKERKTLEALLYTPTTDVELFVGKMLTAWLPAVAVGLGGAVLYSVTANLAAWPTMGEIFMPNAMWIVLILWVSPGAAALGLGATVLVSSRVNSFQEANQLAGVIVLPIVLLVIGQATGVMYLNAALVAVVGLVLWIIAGALLWFGIQTFQRTEIIPRL